MATNKEQIEKLEEGLGNVQDNLERMEMGIADKISAFGRHVVKDVRRFLG